MFNTFPPHSSNLIPEKPGTELSADFLRKMASVSAARRKVAKKGLISQTNMMGNDRILHHQVTKFKVPVTGLGNYLTPDNRFGRQNPSTNLGMKIGTAIHDGIEINIALEELRKTGESTNEKSLGKIYPTASEKNLKEIVVRAKGIAASQQAPIQPFLSPEMESLDCRRTSEDEKKLIEETAKKVTNIHLQRLIRKEIPPTPRHVTEEVDINIAFLDGVVPSRADIVIDTENVTTIIDLKTGIPQQSFTDTDLFKLKTACLGAFLFPRLKVERNGWNAERQNYPTPFVIKIDSLQKALEDQFALEREHGVIPKRVIHKTIYLGGAETSYDDSLCFTMWTPDLLKFLKQNLERIRSYARPARDAQVRQMIPSRRNRLDSVSLGNPRI